MIASTPASTWNTSTPTLASSWFCIRTYHMPGCDGVIRSNTASARGPPFGVRETVHVRSAPWAPLTNASVPPSTSIITRMTTSVLLATRSSPHVRPPPPPPPPGPPPSRAPAHCFFFFFFL